MLSMSLHLSAFLSRLLATLLVLGALICAPLVIAATAAAATGQVSASNGVLYDSCRNHAFNYSVSPGSNEWNLEVDLVDPRGDVTDGDYLYSGADPTSGSGSFFFCGSEPAGRYTIRATLTWYDSSWNEYTQVLPTSTFTMRKPWSRTTVSVNDTTARYNQVLSFRVRSKVEHPAGYFANEYEYVALQLLTASGWVRIRGTRTLTNDNGYASIRARWKRYAPGKVRAQTFRTAAFQGSTSTYVRIT